MLYNCALNKFLNENIIYNLLVVHFQMRLLVYNQFEHGGMTILILLYFVNLSHLHHTNLKLVLLFMAVMIFGINISMKGHQI